MALFYNYTLLLTDPTNVVIYPAKYYYNGTLYAYIDSSTFNTYPLLEQFKEKGDSYNATVTLLFIFIHWKKLAGLWMTADRAKFTQKLFFVFRKIIKTIIGGFLTLLLFSIMVPFHFILLIIKTVATWIILCQEGESVTIPIGNDALWATTTEIRKPIISALLKLEGELDIENIRNTFTEKVLNSRLPNGKTQFRKLKQVFVKCHGYHVWKDVDNFDIRAHIGHVDLTDFSPKMRDDLKRGIEGESGCSENLVCQFLSQYGIRGIPEYLPQWEIICLTEEEKSGFSVLIRLHHAIGDGMSLIRLMLEILSDTPTKVSLLGPPQPLFKKFLSTLWSFFLIPFGLILVLSKGRENPLHGAELTGKKIFVTSKGILLEDVKSIKRKTKTTVSDILFSCLSSSLASFFEKRHVGVPDISVVVPVGAEDISSPVALQNTMAIGVLTLPTSTNRQLKTRMIGSESKSGGLSIRRLFKVKEAFDSLREDPTVQSLGWMTSSIGSLLPTSICEFLFSSKGKTMAVSNVPGPPHEISIWNRKVLEMRFWVPDRDPTGAGFTIMSYAGQIHVSFSVDKSFISKQEEAEQIINDFIVALETLKFEVEEKYEVAEANEKEILLPESV